MAPPGLPAPWRETSQSPRRPRFPGAPLKPWVLFTLLLAGGAIWVLGSMPLKQSLEGTLETKAISFQLSAQPKAYAPTSTTGFLAVPLRGLAISGLREGKPLSFTLKGTVLRLAAGDVVEWRPSSLQTFFVALRLPPGTTVHNLHGEAERELVLDLRTPNIQGSPDQRIDVSITPPAPAETMPRPHSPGRSASGSGPLETVWKQSGQPDRILNSPVGEFSLLLQGDANLRLRLADPMAMFEPNLPVRDVKFSTTKPSFFDFKKHTIILSNLLSGTLHFGRQQPLHLRANQFLFLDPSAITQLTDLRYQNNHLVVSLVGHANHIGTGLSHLRPTTELTGTLLSRHLSPEQISGFYGFMAGVITSLLSVFFQAD